MKITSQTLTTDWICFNVIEAETITPHTVRFTITTDAEIPLIVRGLPMNDWFKSMLNHKLIKSVSNNFPTPNFELLEVENTSIGYVAHTLQKILQTIFPELKSLEYEFV